EQDLGAVVIERRRVPVREVRVRYLRQANRMRRIADVEQEAVALARATGQSDRGIQRDVVALRRSGAWALDAVALVHQSLDYSAQRGAVCRGRRARPTTRPDDAV